MEVILKGEEYNNAILELLVKILAHQQASTSTLIEMISNSDDGKADEFINLLNTEYTRYSSSILESLYERRGHIDLNNLTS